MAKFSIYSKDGGSVRYSGEPKYNGSYLKVSYVEFSEIASPVPIAWEIGDYVDYTRTGLRYKLYSIPQPKKQARKNTSGEAFVYGNVQLYCATKELEIALFNDTVLDKDKNIHFSTRENVSTYENVYGIAKRIQSNIDNIFPGKWVIKVMDLDKTQDADLIATLSEAKEFTASSASCLGALNAIYNTWEGIGWIHTYDATNQKDVITIGRPNKREDANTTSLFQYGLGKGLTAIKRSQTNLDEFATRLYAYGSDRNMPGRYYNGKQICNAKSVDIANLMIPLSEWGTSVDPDSGETLPDASLAYIQDADAVAKYGLIPKKVYFNGSDNDEIYPSVKNLTAGKLRDAKAEHGDTSYVPSESIYPDDEALDTIKSAMNPTDSGIISEASEDNGDSVIYEEDIDADTGSGSDEIYKTALSIKIIDYEPSSSTARAYMEPDLLFTCDYAAAIGEVVTLTQVTQVTVLDDDGTTFVMDDIRDELDFVPIKGSPMVSVPFKDVSIIATGTIKHIDVYIEISSTWTAEKSMTVEWFQNTGTVHFEFREATDELFHLVVKQIGFDLSKCTSTASSGIATLSMKDGMCGGREFAVRSCTYRSATDDWDLTMKRTTEDSVGMRYPNANFPILAGDKFVILDIEMPELYVFVAEQTLLESAQALYDSVSKVQAYYEPEIDAKILATSGEALKEGMYMKLGDGDIIDGGTEYVLIASLTISESGDNIPTYKITLREKQKMSFAETQATTITNIATQVMASSKTSNNLSIIGSRSDRDPSDYNIFSALRSQMEFLSRRSDDSAKGVVSFLAGLKAGQYVAGKNGSGALVDANGDAVMGAVELRKYLRTSKIWFDDEHYIELDEDGNLHTNTGLWTEEFISARGKDDGGSSGGGTDLQAVWDSLTTNTDAFGEDVIHTDHIPTLEQSKVAGLTAALASKADKADIPENVASYLRLTINRETLADGTYRFAVNHNLGRRPSVTVTDASGNEVALDVKFTDDNNLELLWSGDPLTDGQLYLI